MIAIQPYVALAGLRSLELRLNKQPKSLRSFSWLDLIVRSDVLQSLFFVSEWGLSPPICRTVDWSVRLILSALKMVGF